MTIEFIDNRNRFFEDVKALGRKNSATLGLLSLRKADPIMKHNLEYRGLIIP